MTSYPPDIQRLVDRESIRDCVLRYTRGLDREDEGLLRSAFHADALDDHGNFIGPALDFPKRKSRTNLHWANYQHYVSNQTIELDGDTAHIETYFLAALKRPDNAMNLVGGRYIDRAERRESVWAIAARVVIIEWNIDGPSSQAGRLADPFATGTHDKSDLSYQRPLHVTREFRDLSS